jgi:hypothetical protein
MPLDLPERSKIYLGPATDSNAWNGFELRSDDIVVSTPPKCGTTWVQSITMMLIFGKPGMDKGIFQLAPWLDCAFRDTDETTAVLNAQTHRRCIKSHTPLDGITYDPDVTYIAVYRHPLDVHFSMRKHVDNMATDVMDHLFPEGEGAAFGLFVDGVENSRGIDDLTVASIVYHYQSFKKWAQLANVHLFHYADLTRDLAGQMARLAAIYGYDYDAGLMAELVEGATFKTMKTNAAGAEMPSGSVLKSYGDFFSSATSNKWEGELNADQIAAYDARISALLPPADRRWLEWGGDGA